MSFRIIWYAALLHTSRSEASCHGDRCVEREEETSLLSIRREYMAQPSQFDPPEDDSAFKRVFSEKGKICKGIPQIDSLGSPVNPDASPVCWQIRLSEQKRRMEPRITYNSKRQKFPNRECQRKLGAEYNFYDVRDNDIFDFTAKTAGQRILNVGAYDPVGMCTLGQTGNPNCCNWTGNTRLDYETSPHLCWTWPNNIPWDGTLVDEAFTDQNPAVVPRLLPGFAQRAGCKGGKSKVPGTNQTWCENADNFWKVGCEQLNADNGVTDCGLHVQATEYVYQLPPFSEGRGDGSEFRNPQRAFSIYSSGDDHIPSYVDARLPEPGNKFGDATTVDGDDQPRDDYGWAFKQMHGKGYACIDARVKMLDACEEDKFKAKGIPVMPVRHKVGIFKNDRGIGKQWPALLRVAGNRNHTVYDWHDVRVNGFAVKIYNAADVTGESGENRIHLAEVPRHDYAEGPATITPPYMNHGETSYQPYGIHDAKEGFEGNLRTLQNLTTVDFLFVAIRGQFQEGCMTNTPECLVNVFPAGGNGQCYSSMFLYGEESPAVRDKCKYPGRDTHATWNPLNYTYGSSAALMLGNDNAFKMMVQPCSSEYSDDGVNYWNKITNHIQDPADPNYKANNMNQTLQGSKFQMCIFAQIQENPCSEPTEDETVQWMTDIRFTGRIYIEQGSTARYNQVCDNTVFNPFRTLTSHMPIGSLQRIRQAVYAYVANFRLYHNHGKVGSDAEHQASQLPLQQPNSEKAPKTPPAVKPKCPVSPPQQQSKHQKKSQQKHKRPKHQR